MKRSDASISTLGDAIAEALNYLTYRQREILKLRFGIGDGYTYTLEECGRIFNITRERVRQLEVKAIRRLQHPNRLKILRPFLDVLPDGNGYPVLAEQVKYFQSSEDEEEDPKLPRAGSRGRRILECIAKHGGVARSRDILSEVGIDYNALGPAMVQLQRWVVHPKYGWWALAGFPEERLAALPDIPHGGAARNGRNLQRRVLLALADVEGDPMHFATIRRFSDVDNDPVEGIPPAARVSRALARLQASGLVTRAGYRAWKATAAGLDKARPWTVDSGKVGQHEQKR